MFRLPEEQARAKMLEHGLEPLDPYVNSRTPWRCKHTCGRIVSPLFANVSRGFGVCRYCNSTFPFDGPADVYMVADSNALKIGIASPKGSRISQHTSLGWRLKWRIRVATGDDAYALEQAVIRWWRETLGAPVAYLPADMPQWGSTETVSWDAVSAVEVLEFSLDLAAKWSLLHTSFSEEDVESRPQRPAVSRRSSRPRRGETNISDLTLF